jgi:hypothetical protein
VDYLSAWLSLDMLSGQVLLVWWRSHSVGQASEPMGLAGNIPRPHTLKPRWLLLQGRHPHKDRSFLRLPIRLSLPPPKGSHLCLRLWRQRQHPTHKDQHIATGCCPRTHTGLCPLLPRWGRDLATCPDPMPFCSRKPRNPLRLRDFSAVVMKSDPMRSGKNPGREFGGGRSGTQTGAAADDQRLKGRSNWLFPFPRPNGITWPGPCKA